MNFTSICGTAIAYFIYFQVLIFNFKTDVMPRIFWGTGMAMGNGIWKKTGHGFITAEANDTQEFIILSHVYMFNFSTRKSLKLFQI